MAINSYNISIVNTTKLLRAHFGGGGVSHPADGGGRGGTRSQVQMGVPPIQLTGGTQSQVQAGVPLPANGVPHSADGGVPHPAGSYPILDPGGGIPPSRGGESHPRSKWGSPPIQDWMGYPQSGDRAAYRALATRRAVCLLRPRRRTFLLFLKWLLGLFFWRLLANEARKNLQFSFRKYFSLR